MRMGSCVDAITIMPGTDHRQGLQAIPQRQTRGGFREACTWPVLISTYSDCAILVGALRDQVLQFLLIVSAGWGRVGWRRFKRVAAHGTCRVVDPANPHSGFRVAQWS